MSLLRAPVGYGKSLLARQWLNDVAGSADVIRFTHDRSVVEPSVARSSDALLFLDDVTALDAAHSGKMVVDLLRSHQHLRIVLCTRVSLPLEQTLVHEFTSRVPAGHELAFDACEVAALARARHVDLDESSALRLTTLLGGWPAAVASALSSWPDAGSDEARFDAALATTADQIWHRLTRELVDQFQLAALGALSVVEAFTVDDAHLLLGSADPLGMVASLEEAGVVARRDGHTESWEIPTYLRALLRERRHRLPHLADAPAGPDFIGRLLSAGRPVLAFHEAVRIADDVRTAEIVEQFWPEIANDSSAALGRALVALPEAVASEYPVVAAGRALATGGGTATAEQAARAVRQAAATASSPLEAMAMTTCAAIAMRWRGQLSASLHLFSGLTRQALELDSPTRARLGDLLSEFHLQAGLTHAAAGNLGEAAGQLSDEPHLRSAITTIDGRRTSPLPEPQGFTGARRAWLIDSATRSIDDLDQAAARDALDELSMIAPHRDLWPYPVWLRSKYDLLWGSPDDALRTLRASRAAGISIFGPQGVQAPLLTAAEADILISWGHGSPAASALADRKRYHPLTALARARLALQSGELRQASLTARRVAAEQGSWNRTRLEAQLVWAASESLAGGLDAQRLWSGSLQTMRRLGMAAGPFAFLGSETMQAAVQLVPDLARVEELRKSAVIREVFAAQLSVVRLTERELELIALLHSGLTLEQAAKNMFVTLNTIKSQVRTLYRKLSVTSRAEAVVVAIEHGLVG